MTSAGSKSRIKWEGDSKKQIRQWPGDVRRNIGADLQRLEDREAPLDSRPMGKSLPGVSELRDQDKDSWYRVLYWPHRGWIYVLHCFKKKTNQTSMTDLELAAERIRRIRARNDAFVNREDERD